VPAVIDFILRATGAPQLHWVGHSMGGMLAVGSLSLGGDVARAIASLTMVGSGCYGAGSWHAVLGPALRWLLPFGFPGVVAGHIMAPFVGTGLMGLVESIFYWRSNIEVRVCACKR
jgi:pimeloyl-ACP methyl ester carboxylesterase